MKQLREREGRGVSGGHFIRLSDSRKVNSKCATRGFIPPSLVRFSFRRWTNDQDRRGAGKVTSFGEERDKRIGQ